MFSLLDFFYLPVFKFNRRLPAEDRDHHAELSAVGVNLFNCSVKISESAFFNADTFTGRKFNFRLRLGCLFFLLPERNVDFDGTATITAVGMTDIYVLVVPATDPGGVLFVNYYPNVPNAPQPAREDLGYSSAFWETG